MNKIEPSPFILGATAVTFGGLSWAGSFIRSIGFSMVTEAGCPGNIEPPLDGPEF